MNPSSRRFPLLHRAGAVLAAALLSLAPASPAGAQPRSLAPDEAERLAPVNFNPQAPPEEASADFVPGEAERFRVLRAGLSGEKFSGKGLRLRALEGFLDYNEEAEILYGPGRTQIYYGRYFLEADKVILDNRLREIQAEGNVVLRTTEEGYATDEIHADSIRYNFAEGEGVAFKVEGSHPPVFFKTLDETAGGDGPPPAPPFQQVSQTESLFRNAQITSCDFKIPHYSIRAREVILLQRDRVFFRGATMRVMGMPVMYLPFYSRSLAEGSPWFMQVGMGGRTGARIRFGYEYEHESREPSLDDDDVYETRSSGQAQLFADYLSKRGFGTGFNYQYRFDHGRQGGEFRAYGIEDGEREVSGASPDINEVENDPNRSAVYWNHRALLTPQLKATFNADWFSDPEIFYDVLDAFVDEELDRERQIQRQARGAVTYLTEAYAARIMVEVKDRIGINRYNDYSDPGNNNSDFDFDPGVRLKDSDSNSVDGARWGRVSERLPQVSLASRYLPIRGTNLFALTEFNAYNNLDKGLNIVSDDDDSRVQGVDVYNQMLWRYKLSERYILLAKLGVGAGSAERQEDELGIDLSTLDSGDGIRLVDDDGTFKVGEDRYNLKDIETFYAWADSEIRLNARFSDSLTGYLAWRGRETTNDFIGDFYARAGDLTSREDLYNYRLAENWLLGNLNYYLIYPGIYVFTNAGLNLQRSEDVFPNADRAFWNAGTGWNNRRNTLNLGGSVGWSSRQLYSPSDSRGGTQDVEFAQAFLNYSPLHDRWRVRLTADQTVVSGAKSEASDSEDFTFFTEEETRTRYTLLYGRDLGPKWSTEIKLRWDSEINGLREISWILQRDMHDALAILQVRTRQDISRADSRNDNEQERDISLGIKLKLPEREVGFGPRDIKTVNEREREPVLAQ